jgi:hypothetical protein
MERIDLDRLLANARRASFACHAGSLSRKAAWMFATLRGKNAVAISRERLRAVGGEAESCVGGDCDVPAH